MEKKYLFLLLFLLTVGFASVNTYLDINGKVDMSILESDLDVVFKEVLLNKEKSDNTIIIENGKSFIYSADELNKDNTTSTIDYVVMNRSHQYDVEVTVSCTTDYETYLKYNGTFDNNKLPLEKGILIEAGEIKSGNIIAELIKTNTSEESLVLKCTLNYIPVSRETIVEDEEYIVTLDSGYDEQLGDIKVKYYEEYSKLPELTRSNYKFLGWYTEEDIKVDNNSLVKIKGAHTLKAKWEFLCPYEVGQSWTFDYTGSEQEFSVPCDGNYKIELWGAQGGGKGNYIGGLGAYTKGNMMLAKFEKVYLIVGGKGTLPTNSSNITGGFNGGGGTYGSPNGNVYYNIAGTGGGATDIRMIKTTIIYDNIHKTYTSSNADLYSRIMVAAGGGGGTDGNIDRWKSTGYGAAGGGLIGYNGVGTYYGDSRKTIGGTQTTGGTGQIVTTSHAGNYVNAGFGHGGAQGWAPWGGGGGGYYGGGSGGGWSGAGAGGSSFISGHNGCDAISKDSTSSNIIHTGQPNHYSGYVFTDTVMIDGEGYKWTNVKGEYTGMPTHDGTGTMTGNSGNGYAKITYLRN